MEASEKQHPEELPLDQRGSVRALGDRIVIESLTVNDERAARLVRERAEAGTKPAETVADAIEIGARVLDAEGTAANVDYVRRELESGLGILNRELAGTLEQGNTELAERIAESFGAGRSGSVQQQIKEMLAAATDRQRHELTKMLTAEDGSNPLVAMQTRIRAAQAEADVRHHKEVVELRESHTTQSQALLGEVAELRKELARLLEREDADDRVAEAEQAGTRKGRSFEERVHVAIEAIADARGDVAHATGDAVSEGGGKKGDSVVELEAASGAACGRIVFEAKNRKLSRQDAWKELNAALEERGANFAVLIVAGEENVPAHREVLTEYEGNKLIVAVDRDEPAGIALEAAYRLAVARVRMTSESSLTLDAAGVRDATDAAKRALDAVQGIRRSLKGAEKGITGARDGVGEMTEAVRENLERIESLIDAAAEAEGSDT